MLAFAIAGAATAQTFPKFSGLVVDDANVIPDDREAALRTKLEEFQKRTGRQFVVATIGDMQGYDLADYGYRLGRAWGVGLKDADNGAILFIAPNQPKGQRGPRIEVGRRLEPILTDAMSSIIVRTKIMPILTGNNDIPGALDSGADAVIDLLGQPDAQAKAQADAAIKEFDRARKKSSGDGLPFGLIFWGFVVLFVILAMRRGRSGAKGPWGQQRYRSNDGGSGWIWLWAASELMNSSRHDGGSGGGGGGDFGGGGASGDW